MGHSKALKALCCFGIFIGYAMGIAVAVGISSSFPPGTWTCEKRLNGEGFKGDANFYGLGIRIGIYLQWLSSVLLSLGSTTRTKVLTGTCVGLALAMVIAIWLLVLSHACTFAVEIIVVLYAVIGGYFVTIISQASSWDMKSDQRCEFGFLEFSQCIFTIATIPVSVVFWDQMRIAENSRPLNSPEYIATVFFGYAHGANFANACAFMIWFSGWMFGCGMFTDIFTVAIVGEVNIRYVLMWFTWIGLLRALRACYSRLLAAIVRSTLRSTYTLPYQKNRSYLWLSRQGPNEFDQ